MKEIKTFRVSRFTIDDDGNAIVCIFQDMYCSLRVHLRYPPLNDGRNALKEDLLGPGKVCGPQIDIGSDMDRFPAHWSSFNIYRKYVKI